MRVFVTGATGFIGSALVPQLIQAGHQVVGLCRSDAGAEALVRAGVEVSRGDVNDLDHLRTAAQSADVVIHAAFNHDFSKLKESSENDRKVIETLGDLLKRTGRPTRCHFGHGPGSLEERRHRARNRSPFHIGPIRARGY
jgi:nucleoside-diphosphate-sugar epimerase